MRSIALCVCAFALIACSSQGTGQTAGGDKPLSTQQGNGNRGGGANGAAAVTSGGDAVTSGDATAIGGCTYTQGFWKTHPSAWPVTSLTIGGVVYSEQQLLNLFNTPPKGDASLILGHQLIAALLNAANGAVPSATVKQAINDAQTWMTANRGNSAGLPYGVSAGSAAGQQATALTQSLDDFNSGLAGTPHCGSGGSSGGSGSGGSSGSGSSGGGSPCGDGVQPCPAGTDSSCPAGTQCIEACCVSSPPPPSTTLPPPVPEAGLAL